MFSKKRQLHSSKKWDREFLLSFISDLRKGGFDDIYVKLPINFETLINDQFTEEQIVNNIKSRRINIDDFLNEERNYKAIIFVSKNPTTGETIKVLFGNVSEKTNFGDSTFPSGHSASSTLYVQSPDMARVIPLFDFVYDYLSKKGDSYLLVSVIGFFSIILLSIEVLTLLDRGKLFLTGIFNINPVPDVIVIIISLFLIYNYFKAPMGISVNDRSSANLVNFLRRAIRGEMRDNPIINLLVTVIGTIVAGIILFLLGLV